MHSWVKKPFESKAVGHIADWSTLLALIFAIISGTGLMAWAASSITLISQHGWGAIVFAGVGMACLAAFALRALWPIFVYFRSPQLLQGTTNTILPSPPDYSEKFRQFDRANSVISNAIINDIFRRRIKALAVEIPNLLSNDDKLHTTGDIIDQTNKINSFLIRLGDDLRGSFLAEEFDTLIEKQK